MKPDLLFVEPVCVFSHFIRETLIEVKIKGEKWDVAINIYTRIKSY